MAPLIRITTRCLYGSKLLGERSFPHPAFYIIPHSAYKIKFKNPKTEQPRMAPANAPQNTHHELQLPRPSLPPTPLPPNNLFQTIHLLPHLRPHPRNSWGLRPLPHILPRRRSPRLPPPAVGITFGDGVIAILGYGKKSSNVNLASKMLGYICVFAWFTYCMPIWLDPQVHAGTVDGFQSYP